MISALESRGHFLCGAGTADITPPLEVGYLASSVNGTWQQFRSVRTPLMATALWIQAGEAPVAIVSLDLLGLTDSCTGGWTSFKQDIAVRVKTWSILPDNIILCCTHTHSAPETLSLSELEDTEMFRLWMETLKQHIAAALDQAASGAKSASLAFGDTALSGFSLQRRIATQKGIILSDAVQPPSADMLARQPVDHRVRVLQFSDAQTGEAIATVIHAICHPVHEMCHDAVSADFPGEMRAVLAHQFGTTLFLNGAAGDINPISTGEGAGAAHAHGVAMADAVKAAQLANVRVSPVRAIRRDNLMQTCAGIPGQFLPCIARIAAVQLGDIFLVFLPGEPFIDIALDIERNFPGQTVIVVGYSENSIGYIPTEKAMNEGGYETGPGRWSYLAPGSEQAIVHVVTELLNHM